MAAVAAVAASAIRDSLLFGTGKQLADTVRSVLSADGTGRHDPGLVPCLREEDADAIQQLLFGTLNPPVPGPKPPTKSIESADLKRGWFRRR